MSRPAFLTRSRRLTLILSLAVSVGASVLAGCDNEDPRGNGDEDPDTRVMDTQTPEDVAPDTPESPMDVTPDIMDVSQDTLATDTRPDIAPDTRPDTAPDTTPDTQLDIQPDTPPLTGCAADVPINQNIVVDPNGPIGQFYARADFDGNGVWVAYAGPESPGAGDEDVYAARIDCTGTVSVGPLKVNTTASGQRAYDVSMDVVANTVHIAWTTETPAGDQIAYRAFNVNGTPSIAAQTYITPQNSSGDPVAEEMWETDIAGLPNGGAAVVAAYAPADLSGDHQIAVQEIDDRGNRVGAAFDAYTNTEATQRTPMVEDVSNNIAWVTWTSQTGGFGGPSTLAAKSINFVNPGQGAPLEVGPSGSPVSPLASTPVPAPVEYASGSNPGPFVVHTGSSYSIEVSNIGASSYQGVVVSGSGINFWPDLATTDTGGAVAWLQANPSPIQNAVKFRTFEYSASGFSTGQTRTLPLELSNSYARQPYGPTVVHIGGDVFFVAWAEGASTSDTRVVGRFVR